MRAKVGKDGKDRVLTATKHLRGQKISKKVSREAAALLNRYDLMIDVVAGYVSKEEPAPDNKVTVQGFTEYHGVTCSRQQHPLIAMLPVNLIEEFATCPRGIKWHAKQTEPRVFLARKLTRDTAPHDSKLGAIFDIFTSLWPGAHQKHLSVIAVGCGRRAPGGGAPLTELSALVRIFRSDTWSVVLKLPPLGKYSHEQARTQRRGGEVTRSATTTRASRFGGATGTATTSTTTAGGAVTRGTSGSSFRGSQGTSYSTTRGQRDGVATYDGKFQSTSGPGRETHSVGDQHSNVILPDKIKRPSRFTLVVKRNDREIDSAGFKELIESVRKIAEIIKGAFDALKRSPQLGWKITFSISVLEGSIEGQWGSRMLDTPIDARYLPVVTFFSLKIDVMLLDVSAELSFGVEAKALGTGVQLKVSGTIGCRVPLNVHVAGTQDPFEVKLTPSIECKLSVVADASVVGLSLVNAQASASGGITVDGKFVVDPTRGLDLVGTVKRKPIIVKAQISWFGARRGRSIRSPSCPEPTSPSSEERARTAMETHVIYAELEVSACTAELYVNGFPLSRLTPETTRLEGDRRAPVPRPGRQHARAPRRGPARAPRWRAPSAAIWRRPARARRRGSSAIPTASSPRWRTARSSPRSTGSAAPRSPCFRSR